MSHLALRALSQVRTQPLVVIDGDPLASISDIRKTVMTFRSGVMYPSKELYATVGVSP